VNCSVAILIAVEDAGKGVILRRPYTPGPYLIILSPCEFLFQLMIDSAAKCNSMQSYSHLIPFHQAALLTHVEVVQAAYNLKFLLTVLGAVGLRRRSFLRNGFI
jgi:hypothetical protein